jgi:hypothetical protein
MYNDPSYVDRIIYKTSHVQTGSQNDFPTAEEHEPGIVFFFSVQGNLIYVPEDHDTCLLVTLKFPPRNLGYWIRS